MVSKRDADNASVIDGEVVQDSNTVTENLPAIQTDWRQINSWQDALNLPSGVMSSTHALGDGSVLITKDQLENVGEFIVLDWHEVIDKETLNEYLNVLVINTQGEKARFNDGSTGIAKQLRTYEAEYGKIPLHCKGVHRSDYVTEIDGRKQSGTTYYLK